MRVRVGVVDYPSALWRLRRGFDSRTWTFITLSSGDFRGVSLSGFWPMTGFMVRMIAQPPAVQGFLKASGLKHILIKLGKLYK